MTDNLASQVIKDYLSKNTSDGRKTVTDPPNPIALAAKNFIKKLRQHIEQENCAHCRGILGDD
jgi:hypothetical protein